MTFSSIGRKLLTAAAVLAIGFTSASALAKPDDSAKGANKTASASVAKHKGGKKAKANRRHRHRTRHANAGATANAKKGAVTPSNKKKP